MRASILTAFVLMLMAAPASAACLGTSPNLTAPTWKDVRACHRKARNGDTITVTPGSYAVTRQVTTITKYIKLVIAGVTLTDNMYATSGPNVDLLTIHESAAGNTTLDGGGTGTILMDAASHANENAPIHVLGIGRRGKPVVIKNIVITGATSTSLINFTETTHGLVSGNNVRGVIIGPLCLSNSSFVRVVVNGEPLSRPPNWGPPTYGSADTNGDRAVYVENNIVRDVNQPGIDVDTNAKVVMRFNTFINSSITHHGDTSRGGRYSEIYKNTFVLDQNPTHTVKSQGCELQPAGLPPDINGWVSARAGTMRVIDNTLPTLAGIGYSWGDKSAVRFLEWKLRRNQGYYACWVGDPITNPPGTVSYPSPRQVGWGYSTGGTCVGSTYPGGVICQDLEPVYLAGNTGSNGQGANYDSLDIGDWGCSSDHHCDKDPAVCARRAVASSYLQENREIYPQKSPFTGASGTGYGPRSSRPSTCTAGTAWYATDEGSWNTSGRKRGAVGTTDDGLQLQGVLDICTATNTWTPAAYTPYTYPHPLASAS